MAYYAAEVLKNCHHGLVGKSPKWELKLEGFWMVATLLVDFFWDHVTSLTCKASVHSKQYISHLFKLIFCIQNKLRRLDFNVDSAAKRHHWHQVLYLWPSGPDPLRFAALPSIQDSVIFMVHWGLNYLITKNCILRGKHTRQFASELSFALVLAHLKAMEWIGMISDKDRLALDRASKWPELGWMCLKL